MILFNCKACGNEIEVSDDKKGKRGKCPVCSSINIVPDHTKKELIFDETEVQCKNPIVQEIYDEVFSSSFKHRIINSEITTTYDGDDLVFFTFQLGDHGERKQLVALSIWQPIEGVREHPSLSVEGNIRNLKDATADELREALREVNSLFFVSLRLDDDYNAELMYMADLTSVNIPFVVQLLGVIAVTADKLKDLFGTDES